MLCTPIQTIFTSCLSTSGYILRAVFRTQMGAGQRNRQRKGNRERHRGPVGGMGYVVQRGLMTTDKRVVGARDGKLDVNKGIW